jgi:hypothetical protein
MLVDDAAAELLLRRRPPATSAEALVIVVFPRDTLSSRKELREGVVGVGRRRQEERKL